MRLLSSICIIVCLMLNAFPTEEAAQGTEKLVEKLGNNRFQLGEIIIDKDHDSLRFPAEVNMNEGLLELLLCTPYGKTHESLFVTEIDATYLNLALIMIGCKPATIRPKHQGDDVIPDGTLVIIEVSYIDEDDEEKTIRAEDWIYNKKTDEAMQHTNWVYTGSYFAENEYMAKLTGTYIVTFHDPNAIIDLPLKEAADDTVFWVNADAAKKKGYPVELIITRAGDIDTQPEEPPEEPEENQNDEGPGPMNP